MGSTPAVTEAVAAYRMEEDVVGRFLGERCLTNSAARVRPGVVREAFKGWCASFDMPGRARGLLKRELKRKGYIQRRIRGTNFWCGFDVIEETTTHETDEPES